MLSVALPLRADEAVVDGAPADEQAVLFGELPSVFSASRHEQPITKAPAAVDVITSEQIKHYGWRTVAAMLGSLPGFLSTYDRAYQHVGVRGFAPPGDYNTRILVLIDGHRVNESLQDYAGLGRDFLVDVENIERVEVVRGPASSLYGSSAVFAVVNVITQRGRDLQGVRLGSEVASYDSHQGQVSYGQKFANGMEGLLSASYYHSDGHHTLNYGNFGSANWLDQEQVERLFGKLAWGDFTLSSGYMQRKKYLPAGSVGADLGVSGSHYHDRRAYADLNYRHNFAHDWELTGRLFWDGYEFDDNLNSLPNPAQLLTNQDYWQGNWMGGEMLLSHTFFDSHRLTLGSEYRRNYAQRMANFDLQPYLQWADNRLNSSIAGVYLQDEWAILDNLSLHAGARYDYYDNFGGTANPRLGLIYQPFTDTTIKLLYGTAFRAPNAFETYYTCCSGTWIGNPALKPERIESYEIVLEQKLNEYLNLRLSPYYNRLNDLISQVDTGVRQFRNQGKAEAHGVETQLQARYQNFESRFSYTYQQTRIAGFDTAPNSPTHMLKLNLSAPLWQDKLFASLEVQYVSQRDNPGYINSSSYTVSNLVLFTRKWLPGVETTGGVYNLFDERYSDPRIPPNASLPDQIPQDGRNFRLRVGLEF
ncbi:TonB-dependent receptor plug domain-containing protein [Methylomonas albis]|uniref:TonB-dependent receptor n=1 Tax=Methylomonas albis TaxID=1854563 RepID=A0ABR9CYA8_9GAMM|nr:TonB-dependent receptor [Methylomonas albis]MBD9354954.1 TonB-dependent receptor [Methylomonas albis]